MPHMYQSFIFSKIDYKSLLYGSASESTFYIVNTVNSTHIHLTTGTFCTTDLGSMYVKAWDGVYYYAT